ncbi:diguanylate cyclase domain-containing protein [Solibacillus palustris]
MENFKQINDIYVHAEGDILLSKVMKKIIKLAVSEGYDVCFGRG